MQTKKRHFLNIFPSIECYAQVQFDGLLIGKLNKFREKAIDEFSTPKRPKFPQGISVL